MVNFKNKKHMWVISALALWFMYVITSPSNHSEAEDVYDFALKVEQGCFADQAGVNRVLALPMFGVAYQAAQALGYSGRAFPVMIFINRLLAVACVVLFWRLLGGATVASSMGIEDDAPPQEAAPHAYALMPNALLLAFSYGFWRYANEAETYILASVFVLGAWCLVMKQSAISKQQAAMDAQGFRNRARLSNVGYQLGASMLSAVGILVHLLNLVPLLLIIPLYYLLSRQWKRAVIHGLSTGLLVALGYALCFQYLDWGELGAQHHQSEAGFDVANLVRGAIACGQCLVSGNFLFGFQAFRDELIRLFPSRMLDEEFFMAAHMPAWIPWAGCATLAMIAVCSLRLAWRNVALECGGKRRATPLWIASLTWLVLYAGAVMRTESGSPELWIMALIPFWLSVAPLLHGARGMVRRNQAFTWILVAALFLHNLVAGLLPVMSQKTDYHAAKGRWLVAHGTPSDLILTDYEPVMIFYLKYHAQSQVLSSSSMEIGDIGRLLETRSGEVYALASFFQPMESMKVRSPGLYRHMAELGQVLRPDFEQIEEDGFGGIYELRHGTK